MDMVGMITGGLGRGSAVFDGVNTVINLGGDLPDQTNGKQYTFSTWVYVGDYSSNAVHPLALVFGGDVGYPLRLTGSGSTRTLQIRMLRFFSSIVALQFDSSVNVGENTWLHIMCSVDMSNVARRHVYVNDVAYTGTWTTYNNEDLRLQQPNTGWIVGGDREPPTPSAPMSLAEMYFTGSYIDLSIEANRRKFITADGLPARLSSDGSLPTGTTPWLYLSGRGNAFAKNRADPIYDDVITVFGVLGKGGLPTL
jgi:hypothetical protein